MFDPKDDQRCFAKFNEKPVFKIKQHSQVWQKEKGTKKRGKELGRPQGQLRSASTKHNHAVNGNMPQERYDRKRENIYFLKEMNYLLAAYVTMGS